jgi:hypothetical protein
MNTTADPIMCAADCLEQALVETATGREEVWAMEMDHALADVDEAVRHRDADLKARGGQLVDVDRQLLPSPTTERRANGLRHELDGVRDEVLALQLELRNAASRTRPDLGTCRARANRLLDVLRRFRREEGVVIQDALNTDIGGAD